jgi:putative transposase
MMATLSVANYKIGVNSSAFWGQRKGFRLFWSWRIRHGKPGRPAVPKEVRKLIRMLSQENPLWGAPHIHGELLKLGLNIGETSVGKYMVRRRTPPS